MADDETAADVTDVEAMLEGNEEVVQHQLRAGNISSGRAAGQCAKEQKKRDASEQSTEEAPSSEEVEVAPRRFDGTMQPGWGFLMLPKSSSLSASTAPGEGATAAPAPKKAKVSHETMALKWETVCGWRDSAMATARMVDNAILLARVFTSSPSALAARCAGFLASRGSPASST